MRPHYDVGELNRLYRDGGNIIDTIRAREGSAENSPTAILYSYDLQAGSYVEAAKDPAVHAFKIRLGNWMADLFTDLGAHGILDAGAGEATTLSFILNAMSRNTMSGPAPTAAFDISLSRLLFARNHLRQATRHPVMLQTGTLENIPFETESCDVVFTSHAIEPNGGREREILTELLRVAGRYLVLFEPSWELGSAATRERMERLHYVRGLPDILASLGAKILRHELWEGSYNPANESAVIVAQKPGAAQWEPRAPVRRSPVGFGPLVDKGVYLYSREDGLVFPVIEDVACLLPEHGILAARLDDAIAS